MTKQNYIPHIFALSFIFTLGNAIIIMPATNFINLILSCALSLALVLLVSLLLKWGQKNKAVYLITALLLCAVTIYGAATTFLDYINYLKTEQTLQLNKFLLAFVLAVIIIFFASSKKQAIYKYCLFTFVILVAIMLISLAGGIKIFDYKNLKVSLFDFSFLPKQFFCFFLPIAVLPILNNNKEIKPTVYGILLGFAFLLLAALQVALTLGTSHTIKIPYLKAISAISSGSLFTRLDGAIWFLFFVSAIVKIAICVKVFLKIIKNNHN